MESILEDFGSVGESREKQGRAGLIRLLENRGIQYVDFNGWERIDMKEKGEGKLRNRPRIKITDWGELLAVANG